MLNTCPKSWFVSACDVEHHHKREIWLIRLVSLEGPGSMRLLRSRLEYL